MIHSLLQSRRTCCVANRRPKNPYREIIPLRRTEEKFKNRKLTQKVSFLRIVYLETRLLQNSSRVPFFFRGIGLEPTPYLWEISICEFVRMLLCLLSFSFPIIIIIYFSFLSQSTKPDAGPQIFVLLLAHTIRLNTGNAKAKGFSNQVARMGLKDNFYPIFRIPGFAKRRTRSPATW